MLHRRLILLAALLAVPLAGCQGEPEKRQAPASEPASTAPPATAPAAAEAPSAADCKTSDETQHVTISLHGPEGMPIFAIAGALTYPTDDVAIPGRGNDTPAEARGDPPEGAMAGVFDEDGQLKFVVANATAPLPRGKLLTLRFSRCEGAAVAAADAFECTVLNATDKSTNAINGVTCSVAVD